MANEEIDTEVVLKFLTDSIKNFKAGNSFLGDYRLYSLKTEYSVDDFTNLIFNPILGLSDRLISRISLPTASSKEWLKRVANLKKIYFSICFIKTFDTRKKSVQLSISLIDNGTGNPNDTKPVILLHLY